MNKNTQKTMRRVFRFLEFFLVGVVLGIVEDLLAIVFATGHAITPRVFVIAAVVAIPFAAVSELLVDSAVFRKKVLHIVSLVIPDIIEKPVAKISAPRHPNLEIAHRRHRLRKKDAKKAILEHIRKHKRSSNDDIQKLLGISDPTATRYLEELEQAGKIEQIGTTGHAVFYRRRTSG